MDISPLGLAKSWLPHLPAILRTTVLSALQLSPSSEHQDFLTKIIVESARPVLRTPCALLKSQIQFNQDFGVWGRLWVAKYNVPSPLNAFPTENERIGVSVSSAVAAAIHQLGVETCEHQMCHTSAVADVETEWTGYRPKAWHISPRPAGYTERQMYNCMMEDADPDGPTILYFHGGAFCLMDPATERWPTSTLAQATKGRILAVRYRLAPQNPFPAALIDALVTYLALLYPPPGAYHKPVHPSKIILAGDSSGAGLAASLQLLLLTLYKQSTVICWHSNSDTSTNNNNNITIPNPPNAGLALTSPWLDISRCLPSTILNAQKWDIIAPPPLDAASPPFPSDSIWPASPPRAETYCNASMVDHPLVSPLAATSMQWHGCPPVYLCVGWEGMTDEAEVFARRVYGSGTVVVFDGYTGMPHCFSMFPWNEAGRRAQRNTAAFCTQAVHAASSSSKMLDASSDLLFPHPHSARWTRSVDPHGPSDTVPLAELGLTQVGCGYARTQPLTDAFVNESMAKSRQWRMQLEEAMVRQWKEASKKTG